MITVLGSNVDALFTMLHRSITIPIVIGGRGAQVTIPEGIEDHMQKIPRNDLKQQKTT